MQADSEKQSVSDLLAAKASLQAEMEQLHRANDELSRQNSRLQSELHALSSEALSRESFAEYVWEDSLV